MLGSVCGGGVSCWVPLRRVRDVGVGWARRAQAVCVWPSIMVMVAVSCCGVSGGLRLAVGAWVCVCVVRVALRGVWIVPGGQFGARLFL